MYFTMSFCPLELQHYTCELWTKPLVLDWQSRFRRSLAEQKSCSFTRFLLSSLSYAQCAVSNWALNCNLRVSNSRGRKVAVPVPSHAINIPGAVLMISQTGLRENLLGKLALRGPGFGPQLMFCACLLRPEREEKMMHLTYHQPRAWGSQGLNQPLV